MTTGCTSGKKETESASKEKTINQAAEKTADNTSGKTSVYSPSDASFTNQYGTSTTKCAKEGCNNYIASSGDTAYCSVHSNKCLECGKYIDGDAMYCMDCLTKAASSSSDSSGSSSNGSSNSSGSSGGYSYNSDDPYYSSNDHNGDGKINDQEFQDAMNDAIDDLLAASGY